MRDTAGKVTVASVVMCPLLLTISDWILLITAVIVLFYTIETHKMRREMQKQLEMLRKTALLSAYDVRLRINTRIIEKDSQDDVARQMPQYQTAIKRVSESAEKLESLIRELNDI